MPDFTTLVDALSAIDSAVDSIIGICEEKWGDFRDPAAREFHRNLKRRADQFWVYGPSRLYGKKRDSHFEKRFQRSVLASSIEHLERTVQEAERCFGRCNLSSIRIETYIRDQLDALTKLKYAETVGDLYCIDFSEISINLLHGEIEFILENAADSNSEPSEDIQDNCGQSETTKNKSTKNQRKWNADYQAAADEYIRLRDEEGERISLNEFARRYTIEHDIGAASTLKKTLSANRDKWDPEGKYRVK